MFVIEYQQIKGGRGLALRFAFAFWLSSKERAEAKSRQGIQERQFKFWPSPGVLFDEKSREGRLAQIFQRPI